MSNSPHVLVVDDQAEICELIRERLAGDGYRVSSAVNGRSALKLLQIERFDVAIVDALLPHGVSGRKVAEEAALAGTSVIMITGSVTMRDQLEGSPFRVLMKPFRLSELAAAIRELRSPPA